MVLIAIPRRTPLRARLRGAGWIPWLKKELEKEGGPRRSSGGRGRHVIVPNFATPRGQILGNWLKEFAKYRDQVHEGSILVGHSLGATFLLTLAEKSHSPTLTLFLVSGFTGKLGIEKFDKINKTFAERKFNWKKIALPSRLFHVIHGDNDPYVPMEKAEEIAKNLGVEVEVIKNGGHLNKEAGFTKFPYLLDKIIENK